MTTRLVACFSIFDTALVDICIKAKKFMIYSYNIDKISLTRLLSTINLGSELLNKISFRIANPVTINIILIVDEEYKES